MLDQEICIHDNHEETIDFSAWFQFQSHWWEIASILNINAMYIQLNNNFGCSHSSQAVLKKKTVTWFWATYACLSNSLFFCYFPQLIPFWPLSCTFIVTSQLLIFWLLPLVKVPNFCSYEFVVVIAALQLGLIIYLTHV